MSKKQVLKKDNIFTIILGSIALLIFILQFTPLLRYSSNGGVEANLPGWLVTYGGSYKNNDVVVLNANFPFNICAFLAFYLPLICVGIWYLLKLFFKKSYNIFFIFIPLFACIASIILLLTSKSVFLAGLNTASYTIYNGNVYLGIGTILAISLNIVLIACSISYLYRSIKK